MPPKGMTQRVQVTPANKAQKKARVLELVAEGQTLAAIAAEVGCAPRTIHGWRQQDERFAVAYAEATEKSTDILRKTAWDIAMDPDTPSRDRILMIFFLLKQRDPSYRENAKLEHSLAPGLGKTLLQLAKAAEE